mgnify:CR=1 FL=1
MLGVINREQKGAVACNATTPFDFIVFLFLFYFFCTISQIHSFMEIGV